MGGSQTHVTANTHILIRLPSNAVRVIETKPGCAINLGKFGTFQVDHIVGFPFGQSFEILEGKKVRAVSALTYNNAKPEDEEVANDEPTEDTRTHSNNELDELISLAAESSENNQNIINIGSQIQELSWEDIELLKKKSDSGEVAREIIERMISSHKGFHNKTVFSQEKYLKRKQEKYMRRFTVEYLGPSQMLQVNIEKDANRVMDLSEETLGMMLSYANVRPGGRYLLVDETGGVLLYAMMERMGGEGQIVVAHENEQPNHFALNWSNYPQTVIDGMVKNINWLQVFEPEEEKVEWKELDAEEVNNMKPNKRQQYQKRKSKAFVTNEAIDIMQGGNFDGLVYCSTLDPTNLIPRLLDFVGGSRPIVVYSQYKEILVDTFHALNKDLRVLAPYIFETRARPFQTIPGRIHPMMTIRGGGGYILWGTKVFPKKGVTAIGRGLVRKSQRKKQKLEDRAPDSR